MGAAILGTLGMLVGLIVLGRVIKREHEKYWDDHRRDLRARLLTDLCKQDREDAERYGLEYDPIESRRKWAKWLGVGNS